jgi:hypothetical protein
MEAKGFRVGLGYKERGRRTKKIGSFPLGRGWESGEISVQKMWWSSMRSASLMVDGNAPSVTRSHLLFLVCSCDVLSSFRIKCP